MLTVQSCVVMKCIIVSTNHAVCVCLRYLRACVCDMLVLAARDRLFDVRTQQLSWALLSAHRARWRSSKYMLGHILIIIQTLISHCLFTGGTVGENLLEIGKNLNNKLFIFNL